MNVRAQGAGVAFYDLRALVHALPYPVESFHVFRTDQKFNKVLIMSYHQELKVTLLGAAFYYPTKRYCLVFYLNPITSD